MTHFFSIYKNDKEKLLALVSDEFLDICHETVLKFLEKHNKLTITHSADKEAILKVNYNEYEILWEKTENHKLTNITQIKTV